VSVVLDASALIALVANEPEGTAVSERLAEWSERDYSRASDLATSRPIRK
jgi:uncharacterized protein with PIN domain